jgi:hypothetical protein
MSNLQQIFHVSVNAFENIEKLVTTSDGSAKPSALWHSSNQSPELLQAIPNDISILRQIDRKHETKE